MEILQKKSVYTQRLFSYDYDSLSSHPLLCMADYNDLNVNFFLHVYCVEAGFLQNIPMEGIRILEYIFVFPSRMHHFLENVHVNCRWTH